MNLRSYSAAAGAALALLVAVACPAQIPAKFNYQVMLTDDADEPLAGQAVTMVFSLYDAESGGTQFWTETQTPTTNSIGVVSVVLGNITPIAFDFDQPYWLEVEVNGQTLSPRRPLTASPYAGHAAVADDSDKLGGIEASEYALLSDLGAAGDGHSLDAVDGAPTDAVYVDATGNVGVGTTTPEASLHVEGALQAGSPAATGNLDVYQAGIADPVATLEVYGGGGGGRLALRDTNGGEVGTFGPSMFGGGYLHVSGANGSFSVAGTDLFTGSPGFNINGAASSVTVNTGYTGDASVDLPTDAIGADEIEAEPGVASIQAGNELDLTTGVILSVAARTITVPSAGYVFVLGTAEVKINKIGGGTHLIELGVSESGTAWSAGAQEQTIQLPGTGVDYGVFYFHAAVSGLFEVSQGTHTFYMNAREVQGDCDVLERQLTVMYFPTAYGTVDTTD